MGSIIKPQPVKLFMSMFAAHEDLLSAAIQTCEAKYGPLDFRSDIIPFSQTNYYEEEFGTGLKRQFIGFKNVIDSADLWKIKVFSNELEDQRAQSGKRTINIDPGYISQANVVLASTKNFFHRIHLQGGIYAEVTLLYQDKQLKALPWTYPDYQSKPCIDFLYAMRKLLRSQLKRP